MAIPLARMPVCCQVFLDDNGAPLSLGSLKFYVEGSSTALAVYADADMSVSLGTTVNLDASGRAPSIFLQPTGYRLEVIDADSVVVAALSGDQLEDVGAAFAANWGTFFAGGSKDVSSGYTSTNDDFLITTDSTDSASPFILNLQASASRTQPLTIKHQSANALSIVPDGSESLENVAAAYSVPAASSPNLPTVTLLPVTNGWLIASSHGL